MSKQKVTALSLGGGYGSVGMALMLKDGLLPGFKEPDVAVFADTQAEPPHVYDTVEWFRSKVDYPVIVVSAGDLWTDVWKGIKGEGKMLLHPNGAEFVDIPVFSDSGIMTRQCTEHYKIAIIKAAVCRFAESKPGGFLFDQYIGLSVEEISRVKDSRVKYITNCYPLIENSVTRSRLKDYLDTKYPEHPIRKSACFFCPFHSIAEWREIRQLYPNLYDEAIQMEEEMGKMKRGPFYLYKGYYGLGLKVAMANADMQGELWLEADQFINECGGHCNT